MEIEREVRSIKTRIQEHSDTISKVNNARDKVYAHKDPKSADVPAIVFQELHGLIKLSADIHNDFGILLGVNPGMFDRTDNWSVDDLLFYGCKFFEITKELEE